MYYRADVYRDAVSVKVLKCKALPYIEKESVTQISVSEVNTIGYFKLPDGLEEYLKDQML